MQNQLKIENVVKLANAYRLALDNKIKVVNLAGLEPTLWTQDNKYDVVDIIDELKKNGFEVEMTTNGSRLSIFLDRFLKVGLSKCRISIHSFNSDIYHKITGRNVLNSILESIKLCKDTSLNIAINRTLLKGFTDDIPLALDFIQSQDICLKLYDLWWVPRTEATFDNYFVCWEEIVSKYVIPITEKVENETNKFNRSRSKFYLNNGGIVDVKHFKAEQQDNSHICGACHFKTKCKETFASYLHVYANGHLTFCNLREDIHLNLNDLLERNLGENEIAMFLRLNFEELIGSNWRNILGEADLRFYINEACNFNCSFPNIEKSRSSLWCLSSVKSKESWDINNYFMNDDQNINDIMSSHSCR